MIYMYLTLFSGKILHMCFIYNYYQLSLPYSSYMSTSSNLPSLFLADEQTPQFARKTRSNHFPHFCALPVALTSFPCSLDPVFYHLPVILSLKHLLNQAPSTLTHPPSPVSFYSISLVSFMAKSF